MILLGNRHNPAHTLSAAERLRLIYLLRHAPAGDMKTDMKLAANSAFRKCGNMFEQMLDQGLEAQK